MFNYKESCRRPGAGAAAKAPSRQQCLVKLYSARKSLTILVIPGRSQGSAECLHCLPCAGSGPPHRVGGSNVRFSQQKHSVGHTDLCTHGKICLGWRPASARLWKCLICCRSVPIAPKLPSGCSCWSQCAATALGHCRFCFCPSPLYNNLLNIRVFLKDVPLVTTRSCFFPPVCFWKNRKIQRH